MCADTSTPACRERRSIIGADGVTGERSLVHRHRNRERA
jgi:hypothetical protein